MNTKIAKYGVKPVVRPKVKAIKTLDLSNVYGQQIVKSETRLALTTHKNTFAKLANM